MRLARGALLAASLLAAGQALAQSHPPSDEFVTQLTRFAREHLSTARMEDGSNVPAETPAERAQPIISRGAEIAVIRRGELSGQMEHCGLDWQNRSFFPFMRRLRAGGWSGKRMAYVGMLHGASQGLTAQALQSSAAACPAEAVAAMEREAETLGDLR